MDDAVTREITELETRYWRALQAGDVETALSMTSDPCVVAGAQGVSRVDKTTYAKLMRNADWEIRSFEFRDVVVEQPAENIAVIGYKVHEELTLKGEPVTLDAADTSIWVRDGGGWTCALHTESPLGDPYGRDRKPAA
jgi:ketosteroid isomerase-like protein